MGLFGFGKKKQQPLKGAQIMRQERLEKEAAEYAAKGWKKPGTWVSDPVLIGPHSKTADGHLVSLRGYWEDYEVAMFCAREETKGAVDETELDAFAKSCGADNYRWRFLGQFQTEEEYRAEYVVFFNDVEKMELFIQCIGRGMGMDCFRQGNFYVVYDSEADILQMCRLFEDCKNMARYEMLDIKPDTIGIDSDIDFVDEEGERYCFDLLDACRGLGTKKDEYKQWSKGTQWEETEEDWKYKEEMAAKIKDMYVDSNGEFCPKAWWLHHNKPFNVQVPGSVGYYRAELEEHEKAHALHKMIMK